MLYNIDLTHLLSKKYFCPRCNNILIINNSNAFNTNEYYTECCDYKITFFKKRDLVSFIIGNMYVSTTNIIYINKIMVDDIEMYIDKQNTLEEYINFCIKYFDNLIFR